MRKNKLLDIVIALVCALGLWLYVVTVVTPEDDITISDIPVTFVGESELRAENELIISKRSVSHVTVKFHGTRAALRQLVNDKGNITASLDVSGLTNERDYSLSYKVTLPSSLGDQTITVTDRKPRTIQFTVERLASKTVEIKGVFDGTVDDGFVEGALTLDQDTVEVTGPKELVEKVSYAQVMLGGERLNKNLRQNVEIHLIDETGEPLNSEDLLLSEREVGMTQEILRERELPLTLQIVPGGGATESDVTVTVEPQTVTVRGEGTMLDAAAELSLGELLLAEVTEDQVMSMPVVLPEGLTAMPPLEAAEVQITFHGLEKKQITVTDLRLLHVQDTVEAELMTEEVTVMLRGTEAALQSIEDAAVFAEIDMTQYTEPGAYTVPARIVTDSDTVGAVGTVEVQVNLTAADREEG